MNTGDVVVEARELVRRYRTGDVSVDAVRGVSLSIRRGEFVALLGPSGCGKSTLLSMLGLIEAPTSGEVVLEESSLKGASECVLQELRRTKIGFVFQAFNLLSTLTVQENIMLPCIVAGWSEKQALQRSEELLARLHLQDRCEAMPATLSGGEMQRVAVARAVSHKPAIVFADEPTGNLDSVFGESVLSLPTEVHQAGTPILMVTHSELAAERCSRIIRMSDGVLVDDK